MDYRNKCVRQASKIFALGTRLTLTVLFETIDFSVYEARHIQIFYWAIDVVNRSAIAGFVNAYDQV